MMIQHHNMGINQQKRMTQTKWGMVSGDFHNVPLVQNLAINPLTREL